MSTRWPWIWKVRMEESKESWLFGGGVIEMDGAKVQGGTGSSRSYPCAALLGAHPPNDRWLGRSLDPPFRIRNEGVWMLSGHGMIDAGAVYGMGGVRRSSLPEPFATCWCATDRDQATFMACVAGI